MGAVKQSQIEQAGAERRQEVREWLQDKLGRPVREVEIDAAWDDFELAEAFAHAMDKDD